MKKLLKILTMVAILAAALFFTGCKQFLEDPEDFLSYWSSEVVPIDFSINKPYQTSNDGALCIPSEHDVTLTIKLRNPKNFTIVTPASADDAGKVIYFPGLSTQPVYGTEYTLQQAGSTLNLVYKSAFLKKHEWSSKNIGPEITFISTDGRKFSKKFSLNLKVDTPPKLSSTVTIGKTTKDGKHYYVIILKADEMSLTAGTATPAEKLHKDIEKLSVAHGAGGNLENISFTAGHTAFDASGRLLAATDVTQITSTDLGGQTAPPWESTFNADPWALRYRTDTEVKTASKTYTFTLIDAKGLKSSPITVPTPLLKAEDVQLSHGTPPNTIPASISPPSNPYTINAGLTDMDVTVTAETATSSAIITGKVEKQDGSGWGQVGAPINSISWNEVDIRLPAPEPNQEVLYKISLTAGGAGFATGTEKTFFVKVTKNTTITIDGSESDAWTKLKTAVENSSPGAPSVIIIDGTIKAPSVPSEVEKIEVRRNVTIEGNTGSDTDKLDANNRICIFHIWVGRKLTLKKLTLLNGNDVTSTGGAIYCEGGKLTTEDVIIEKCKAKNGGAIYAKNAVLGIESTSSFITLKNTQIKSCEATGTGTGEGRGGAIYCKESTLTLDTTTIGGSASTDVNKARRGGGIYFEGETNECSIPSGCTIQYNKVTGDSGATSGGGGVYIQSGKLTLGGTISDNSALLNFDALASGGGVFVGAKGTFIMEAGATISGNKAKWGGGVYVYADTYAGAGSFTMEGGEISGCHAGGSSYSSAQGGGVCIKAAGDKKGSFTMKGGTITGCTAEANTANKAAGGGVYADVETVFKMSGSAVITPSTTQNTLTKSFNDVYLHDVTYAASIIVTDELTSTPAVARLTMKDLGSTPGVDSGYTVGRVVVKGASVDTPSSYILKPTDAAKFQVTPQRGVTPAQNWKVVHDGSSSGTLQLDP